jgi:putative oxidoreductase
MHAVRGFLSLLARLMLAAIFLMSAVAGKIMNFNGTVERMAAEGVPSPTILLGGAIAFLIVGGLSIVLGLWGRFGACLLLVFLGAATYYFHDFWKLPPDTPPERMQMEVISFLKNLALMGAMLFLIANGTGPWSLDNRGRAAAGETSQPDDE